MAGKVLIAGASGVVGSSAIQEFIDGGWEVVSISRRPPLQARNSGALQHITVDLQDSDSSDQALRALRGVTHVVFAAVSESPGLVEGWQDSRQMETNLSMLRNCLDPIIRGSSLEHVSIMQGTKAYGAHLHPIDIPARERSPRDPHESFYWHQEDYLMDSAARNGFSYTIMRPSMIMGGAYGAAMNLAPVLGAYAAICREEGLPFAFPGGPSWILEAVDSRVLAKAFTWAARAPEAKNQHFNITNGDVFEWRSVWPAIADVLGVEIGTDTPRSLAMFLPEKSATWDRVVAKYAIRSFSRTWAAELKGRNIRVNTLSPGATDTPIIDGQFPTKEQADGARAMFSQITPLGRIGRPEELAAAVFYLASDESSFVTGIDLPVDGGITQL